MSRYRLVLLEPEVGVVGVEEHEVGVEAFVSGSGVGFDVGFGDGPAGVVLVGVVELGRVRVDDEVAGSEGPQSLGDRFEVG
ncbi:MAG TPA: hypothetical protein VFA46_24365 [Actinomycetes bacterium]|nr:hypothetical protein [Actinomycetes bacterium]